jgi:hypothetical protein
MPRCALRPSFRRWLSRVRAAALVGALAAAGCAQSGAREPSVVVEPVVFSGFVQVAGPPGADTGVILSTATDEVLVADGPVARELRALEGERVQVTGRLVESGPGAGTLVPERFRVVGDPDPPVPGGSP